MLYFCYICYQIKNIKMKKIYFTLGLGVLFLGANAQQTLKMNTLAKANHKSLAVKGNKIKNSDTQGSVKAARNVNNVASTMSTIWSDDFSSAATWTMTAGAGTTANWTIGTTGGVGTYSLATIASTSAANGFATFDSDNDCSMNQIANLTTVAPINLTGHASVKLTFQQNYRRDADSTRIYVSNNGTTWTNFPVNEQYAANGFSTNPETVGVDISSVAGNQATVWIRFTYYSPTAASTWSPNVGSDNGCGYNWMIDDVSIADAPANDLTAIAAYSGSACGGTLGGVEIMVKNNGTANASNFPLKYTVNGGAPVVETYTGTVNVGSTITYIFNTPVSVTAGTGYNIVAYADITSDGTVSDDTAKTSFAGTPYSIPYTTGFEAAPITDVSGWTPQQVTGTGNTWAIDNQLPRTGTQEALLFSSVNAVSDDWMFSPCLSLTTGVTYQVKYYHACFKNSTIAGAGSLGVFLGTKDSAQYMTTTVKAMSVLTPVTIGNAAAVTAAYIADSASFTVPATGNYVLGFEGKNTSATNTALIALDNINVKVVATSGIKSLVNTADLSVYPNPTSGLLNITTTASNGTVEVMNLMGQVVLSKQLNNGNNSIDISNLSNGVYSVQIMQNNTLTVSKVIKAN